MWLLNAETKTLRAFPGKCPAYAILSHTWTYEEVSFQDVMLGHAQEKKGWKKIDLCCRQAIEDGFEWVWADTCCIDKTSSAELSEAINSMFKWYSRAGVCYAYLEDISAPQKLGHESKKADPIHSLPYRKHGPTRDKYDLTHSRWFTRGWTLQELIAPRQLLFFTSSWDRIGSRRRLAKEISSVTGIHLDLMQGRRDFKSYSVAQRLSWAAKRSTTRKEDQAYSLLGLFDVNMPLLYGEGFKAFQRLQEQIIQNTEELSILAWDHHRSKQLLASSLADFVDCQDIVLSDLVRQHQPLRNVVKSNMNFKMTVGIVYSLKDQGASKEWPVALLGCRHENDMATVIGLQLYPQTVSAKRMADADEILCPIDGPLQCTVGWSGMKQRLVYIDVIEEAQNPEFRDIFVLGQNQTPLYRPVGDSDETHVCIRFADPCDHDGGPGKLSAKAAWPKRYWSAGGAFDLLKARGKLNDGDRTTLVDHFAHSAGSIVLTYSDTTSFGINKSAKLFFRRIRSTVVRRVHFVFQFALETCSNSEQGDKADTVEGFNCFQRAERRLTWISSNAGRLQWSDGVSLKVERRNEVMTDIHVVYLCVSIEIGNEAGATGPIKYTKCADLTKCLERGLSQIASDPSAVDETFPGWEFV